MKKIAALALIFTSTTAGAQTAVLTGFGGITAINAATYDKVGIFGGQRNVRITANKDASAFFVTNTDRKKLFFINAAGNAFTDSMSVPVFEVAAREHTDTLFGISETYAFYRINTATKTVDSIASGTFLGDIEERPNTSEVWTGAAGDLRVYNIAGALTSTTLPLTGNSGNSAQIRFTTTGDSAYVSMNTTRRVYRINAVTKAKIDSVSIPQAPAGMELSADGTRLFTSASIPKKIYVYSTAPLVLIDSIALAKEPQALYRNPYRNEIWAVQQFQQQVYVFNPNTLAAIDSVTATATNPGHLAFGPLTPNRLSETAAQRFRIHPNPAADRVVVSTPNGVLVHYNLLTLDGRQLMSGDLKGGTEISLRSLPTGSYLLQLCDRNGLLMQTEKLTKQ